MKITIRTGYILLAISVIVIYGAFFGVKNYRYSVVKGVQDNGIGRTYGYTVQNYKFKNRIRIKIWERIGLNKIFGQTQMKSVYEINGLSIDEVAESEWIKSDGAIYLDLVLIYHDSIEAITPTRLIYDFHTGEMFINSSHSLWRIFSDNLDFEDRISESEFNDILLELREQ